MTAGQISVAVGGKAVVCCIHDRQKRQVTTEGQVAQLGRQVGQNYDPAQHRLYLCACCENLFVDPTDTPQYCRRCHSTPQHLQGGPLPPPNGTPLT